MGAGGLGAKRHGNRHGSTCRMAHDAGWPADASRLQKSMEPQPHLPQANRLGCLELALSVPRKVGHQEPPVRVQGLEQRLPGVSVGPRSVEKEQCRCAGHSRPVPAGPSEAVEVVLKGQGRPGWLIHVGISV